MARGNVASRERSYNYQDEQGEGWAGRLLLETLEVAVITMLVFLVARLFIQNYQVDGPSMTPTLLNGQYILVNKADYFTHGPQRGDVIVFKFPKDTSRDFVKRVIGIPGDTVVTNSDGSVAVDGVTLNEPYVNDHINLTSKTWRLGPGQYFVMGDNRGDSYDSRDWGPVPVSDILGKAEIVYWPLTSAHSLRDWSGVFAGTP
ncbi:MAG TPA: signal peptidase I [Ktedonobacterales bacterium]|nr:signal peptidase I [Ktedonobacterales bacterium]